MCSCNQPKDANTSANNIIGGGGGGAAGGGSSSGGGAGLGGVVQRKSIAALDSEVAKYQLSNVPDSGSDGSHGRCPKVIEIK